jgi:predicted MFS family arabinose efflux permease
MATEIPIEDNSGTPGISRGLVLLLAVACGTSVANLYYAQPLLHTISVAFHSSSGTTGLIVTGCQIGFAVGLALLVPLGDLVARKRLVPAVLGVTVVGLVLSACAGRVSELIIVALFVGLGSVGAQMLVPLAASLATEESRGRVVGSVMSGLLLGILLARTLSGIVAGLAGWRTVYWVAAVLVLLLAAVLGWQLPNETGRPNATYAGLLASVLHLFATSRTLRQRGLYGGLGFAAFSVFWTTMAFVLAGPPFRYGETIIGLFGLVGAAGAICATVAGRLADRGKVRSLTLLFAVLVLASFGLLYLGRNSLTWMIAGIVVLDLGVQGLQVTNQHVIYGLAPAARSRVNAAYMVCYFAGGALGSALAGIVYGHFHWTGICVLGASIGVLALASAALFTPGERVRADAPTLEAEGTVLVAPGARRGP